MTAYDQAVRACQYASLLEDATIDGRLLHAMQAVADCNDALAECAADLIREGVAAGLSQRQMAAALRVPESTLRGAKRSLA